MSIRVLQWINNFYCDNGTKKEHGREVPLGEFCALGYFDALSVELPFVHLQKEIKTWDTLSELSAKKLDGACSRRNIVCIPQDKERDIKFWNHKGTPPLYFISMLRINKEYYSPSQMLQDMKNLEEADPDAVTYCTYNHSEAIIVKRTDCYSSGINHILSLRDRFSAFKVYTILVIRESILESRDHITRTVAEEQIDCRLHCAVKDYREAELFYKSLKETLADYEGHKINSRRYDTLGSFDWRIEIDQISIHTMLSCYKMGNILTHSHPLFENAFFNIETEILVPVKEAEEDGSVDHGKMGRD